MNFRIHTDYYTCRKLIKVQDYEELLRNDELKEAQKESDVLVNFKEGSLTFDPTYKYSFNSNNYEETGKIRVPSWCDRILFDAESNLTQVYYGRAELKLSDHRPVFGLFEAKVRRINEDAKMEIEEKLIEKYKSLNPVSNTFSLNSSSPQPKLTESGRPSV